MLFNNKIIKKILNKNITVSVAESCTGGLLASKFVSTPGISKVFNMGLIVYSNTAKSSLLKISNIAFLNKVMSASVLAKHREDSNRKLKK